MYIIIPCLICIQLFMHMLANTPNLPSSKKTVEEIQKSMYYREQLFQGLFPETPDQIQSTRFNKIIYFYASSSSSNQILSNKAIIIGAAMKTYLQGFQVQKIKQNMFKRNLSVNTFYSLWKTSTQEIFDFHYIEHPPKKQVNSAQNEKKHQLFVVHHCQSNQQNTLKWLHFVEHYTFYKDYFDYKMTASIKAEDGYFNSSETTFTEFLKQIQVLECPKKMEGFLLQEQINLKLQIQKSNDPAFSPEHRVINRISPEHIKLYYILQKDFPQMDENLICRYLIAKQYSIIEARKAISEYIQWRKKITQDWKYQDFQEFHDAGIFKYLGEDLSGRPVILNKACKVNVNEIDIEKYSYFYIYYLEIYIPSLMRGHVSQIMIIADVEHLTAANFKLALTRRNMEDNLKYSPQRQYKIIGINASNFALYWWKIFSPFIPKRSLSKITVAGSDKQSIFEVLENQMDAEVIPEYLGGKNPIVI